MTYGPRAGARPGAGLGCERGERACAGGGKRRGGARGPYQERSAGAARGGSGAPSAAHGTARRRGRGRGFGSVRGGKVHSLQPRVRLQRIAASCNVSALSGRRQGAELKGSLFTWRPVTSGVPPGAGTLLISIGDMDSGIEFTLIKIAVTPSCVVPSTHWRERMPSRGTWIGLRDGTL